MNNYAYIPGPTRLGIGVENFAFERPTTIPVNSIYAPRYNVKGSLATHVPAYLLLAQSLPAVDLRANGVYFSGTLELQALSEFETAKAKRAA